MGQQKKTNAMRILDRAGIDYNVLTYNSEDGKINGISVAGKIGRSPEIVYKTLVVQGSSGDYFDTLLTRRRGISHHPRAAGSASPAI
jgi:prolyl-tRNA editing enzyme YbaK/EbsC (Cys-tRNA(Pro) deacylase)